MMSDGNPAQVQYLEKTGLKEWILYFRYLVEKGRRQEEAYKKIKEDV